MEGRMYPFANCSSKNTSRASSSVLVMGYTLQLMASGASFLRVMAWSQVLLGGKHCDSSLLNTDAKRWYSGGSVTSFFDCALMASSVDATLVVQSWVSSSIILCLSSVCSS